MSAKSTAKSSVSAAAMGFADAASPAQADEMGDAASPAALTKLEGALDELKALAIVPMLRRAIDAVRENDGKTGTDWALKALNQDPQSGMAWYVLAVAREKVGDFVSSLQAYESALALMPNHADIANDLGRLAFRMGMKDVAEQLFRRYLEAHPDDYGTLNNLISCVRDLGRSAEAIDLLKLAIKQRPDDPHLWNTLGTVLSEQGEQATAIIFFDEALRLDPGHPHARYNRGSAHLEMHDAQTALADCEAAIAVARSEDDRLMMQLARSTIKIGLGRIGEGWDDYEARLAPLFTGATIFLVDRPIWTPETSLEGKTLLVMGEQGLGDEVLFANMLPDVIEALGPRGKLVLALEERLVGLFQRSFPTAEVVPHVTFAQHGRNHRAAPALGDMSRFDLWAPMASLLRRFRRRLEDFPARERFLIPDANRVAHWRAVLQTAPAGRKVGILWKSMRVEFARSRYYSPFQLWSPVLRAPGTTMINLQYGDCDAEIEWARRELGVEIWTPPGIDLKNDLDDIGALACALDLTLGFANATSNIGAACGAATWIVSVPGAWTRLGTDRMPWYPQARIFTPPSLNQWEETMAGVATALAQL
ncbi:MAG TPA: tetratricopeptide repeat protein [Caulobacteraceae bacterium]|nr:tetratricopeptide repeat protein [Caulobacteraceae bacterium]